VTDGVALLLIDNPPVNATSLALRTELLASVHAAESDPTIDAIVIACAGSTFVAGADVREMEKTGIAPILPDVVDGIEAASKPVVAAIHGTALGGGCEIALGCHARIITADAGMGLPEVKLGLIPGATGTQRLPRVIGMLAALDLITSGRTVKATEALQLGLVDRIAVTDLRAEAMDLARSLVGKPMRRVSELAVPPVDASAWDSAVSAVKKKARGQLSPGIAADIVGLAAELPYRDAVARERAVFLELMAGPQSRALRHLFAAERAVVKVPQLDGVHPRNVQSVGVIGSGTMGAGIAVAFADAGYSVTVVETSEANATAGQARIAGLWERQVKSGRISEEDKEKRLGRVRLATDFAALGHVDLVVEAAFEDMSVKEDIFKRLSAIAKPGAVLATNTSYLDINAIAGFTTRPQDVIGLHFFSPANIMRLVEVIETAGAAKDALATGVAVAKKLGKLPVVCGVCDGFVGNRILSSWRAIAEMLMEDGALPQEIDAAMEAFGLAMGPFAVSDLSGLDIALARRKRLAPTRNPATRYASTIADRLCDMGRLGQKTGSGWYAYDAGKRVVDPIVSDLVLSVAAEKGIARQPIDASRIQHLVRAAMVNEGAKILTEGIAARSLDIDVVLTSGYGYPAWRGGPMHEADDIGLAQVLEDIRAVHALGGFGYEPAPLIERLVADGRTFASLKAFEGRGL
jgi:3-hydroxyacyl-CoA dehydrogenase